MYGRRLEFLIGVLVLVSLALLSLGVYLTSREAFEKTYRVTAYFPNARGVKVGTPVRMGGVDIGRVTAIQLPEVSRRGVRLTLQIKYNICIKKDAQFTLASQGLLGERYVDIEYSVRPGDYLSRDGSAEVSGLVPPTLEDWAMQIEKWTEKLEETFDELEGAVAGIKQIVADEELRTDVKRAVGGVADLAEKTSAVMERVEDFVGSADKMTQQFTQVAEKIGAVSDDVRRQIPGISGRIEQLVGSLQQVVEKVTQLVENTERITARIDRGEGTLGAVVTERTLHDRLIKLADSIEKLIDKIERVAERLSEREAGIRWGPPAKKGSSLSDERLQGQSAEIDQK